MRVCPLTELGFRNAETWGKHLWPTAGAILPDPQWASPQLHWEHWGLAGPSVAVTHSCCALHLCHPVPWGCTLPWREPAALMQCRSVSEEALCAPALSRALPSDTHTHCSFAQLPDFLSRKRHLGHTSPCTKKSRGCAFALRHFGYMHLGFSQSALPWRVFFSWLQL